MRLALRNIWRLLRTAWILARYDALFPYYVELCAVSQIRANFTEHGGSPGQDSGHVLP